MRTVEVTGGFGFFGSHVMRAFRAAGWEVNRSGRVREGWYPDSDVVVHCAANCGGIGHNASNGYEILRGNLEIDAAVVEGCVCQEKTLIAIGSVCAYPKHCPAPFHEADLWSGYPEETNAPYGLAKRMLFELCRAARPDGLRSVMLLPTNLYGPGDSFDPERSHVVPAMIRKFVEADGPVELWGTGNATRDFLYVEDAAEAVVRAAELGDYPNPINLGTGVETGILALSEQIGMALGKTPVYHWTGDLDGQPRRVLDTSRAASVLGWKAKTGLREGLRRTVAWYRGEVL